MMSLLDLVIKKVNLKFWLLQELHHTEMLPEQYLAVMVIMDFLKVLKMIAVNGLGKEFPYMLRIVTY